MSGGKPTAKGTKAVLKSIVWDSVHHTNTYVDSDLDSVDMKNQDATKSL